MAVAASSPHASMGPWREAPAYVDLFAPQSHREAYRAYVSPMSLDQVLQQIQGDPASLHPPGAWRVREVIAFDAFGQSGTYNRWTLARLYGSRRARIARGPRRGEGDAIESWMLVSPYPDPAFQQLERGTLILVVRAP